VVLVISHQLLPNTGGINYTDLTFFFNSKLAYENAFSAWNTMFAGHDMTFQISSRLSNLIISYPISLFINNPYLVSYLIVFGSFVAVLLTANFVLHKIYNNHLLSLFLPLFLIFNNFTLEAFFYGSNSFIFLGYISALLVIYNTYFIYKEGISMHRAILLAISSMLSFHPFVYVVINVFILLYFIFLILKKPFQRLKLVKFYILYLIVSILLNLYWMLPFIYDSLSVSNVVTQGADNNKAVFSAYEKISNVVNNLSFISFFGDIGKTLYFSNWQYIYYFSINLLIVLPFFWLRKKINSYYIFLYFSLLCFLELSLGPNGLFLGNIFSYLWEHVPAASFFRSFKRFYILVPIFYMLLIANALTNFKRKSAFISIFAVITCIVHYPLLSGNLLGSLTTFNIPAPYIDLNNELEIDPDLYNVLDLPYNNYEWYSWTLTPGTKLHNPDLNWINYYLSKPNVTLRLSTYLVSYSGHLQNLNENILKGNSIDYETKTLNIKYIMVHKDLVDVHRMPIDNALYDTYFLQNKYPLVKSNEYFNLYLNPSYIPNQKIIAVNPGTNLSFAYKTPSKYTANIQFGNHASTPLVFKESFSDNWKLYNDSDLEGENMFSDIRYLFKKDVFSDTHIKYNNHGNQWTILAGSRPDSHLVLFFKPQAYYSLGLLITILTLISYISIEIHLFLKKKRS
jgi:hypothetical protein